MTLSVFFKLVEIQTKLASIFPFIIGVLFSIYYFHRINWFLTIIFFAALFVFDMTTTAINNYMDYHKAKDEMYKNEVNIVGQAGLSDKLVRNLIIGMLAFVGLVGGYLVYCTGWLILIMGGICCFIGIFYTFGPIPLSRMPLGEAFSGLTMGLGIFLITIFVNGFESDFLTLTFKNWRVYFSADLKSLIVVVWASLPMVFTIANIMLANNLCDLDEDVKNHRYTLPFYIGKSNGIALFDFLMFSCYGVIVIGIFFNIYHWAMLVVFFSLPFILNNVRAFNKKQVKADTFAISIKNLVLFNTSQIVGLLLSLLLVR